MIEKPSKEELLELAGERIIKCNTDDDCDYRDEFKNCKYLEWCDCQVEL